MPQDTTGEGHEMPRVLSLQQFEEEREKIWQAMSPASNPDGTVDTGYFTVKRPSDDEEIEIIESASPDIHVFTSGPTKAVYEEYRISVRCPGQASEISVETGDFALVQKIHEDIIRKYMESRSMTETMLWLSEQSKYSQLRGSKRDKLIMFR